MLNLSEPESIQSYAAQEMEFSSENRVRLFLSGLLIFSIWMLFTFLLEGMLLTLQRPEAIFNRLMYTLIANIIIGTIIALYFVRNSKFSYNIDNKSFGFRPLRYTGYSVILGFTIGLALYIAQSPPTINPIIIANAFAQVLVVTIAEVIVCWVVMGTLTEKVTKDKVGNVFSIIIAIIVSSVLFGFYHFAHSPPFNTLNMVLFLTIIGIMTSIFYFTIRDIYGTIVFHNFLGIFGVISALKASGSLSVYTTIVFPLFITAIAAICVLILFDYFFIRKKK